MHSKEEYIKAWRNLILIVIGCAIALWLLPSCKTVHDVQIVERVKTDTVYKSKTERDSIWLHDSIIERIAGDTVMIERWYTRWRDRLLIDTVYQARVDSVPVPVKVTEYVEKRLNWVQRILIDSGIVFWLVIAIAIAIFIFRKKLPF